MATNVFEGANYLQVCDTSDGHDAEEAAALPPGFAPPCGTSTRSLHLISCHSPEEQRWFIARVTRFPGDGPIRIVVAHENITARKLAEQALGSPSCVTDHSTRSQATPS